MEDAAKSPAERKSSHARQGNKTYIGAPLSAVELRAERGVPSERVVPEIEAEIGGGTIMVTARLSEHDALEVEQIINESVRALSKLSDALTTYRESLETPVETSQSAVRTPRRLRP